MPTDRRHVLQVRLTADEKDLIEKAAHHKDLSVSAYARAELLVNADFILTNKAIDEDLAAAAELPVEQHNVAAKSIRDLPTMAEMKAKRAAAQNRPSAA